MEKRQDELDWILFLYPKGKAVIKLAALQVEVWVNRQHLSIVAIKTGIKGF